MIYIWCLTTKSIKKTFQGTIFKTPVLFKQFAQKFKDFLTQEWNSSFACLPQCTLFAPCHLA